MLIEEIDRLEADIWNERAAHLQAGEQRSSQSLASTLRDRLAQHALPGEPTKRARLVVAGDQADRLPVEPAEELIWRGEPGRRALRCT